MYYEEDVIDGVLCRRGTPGGEWMPFSPQQITDRLISSRANSKVNQTGWLKADAKLLKIRAILGGQEIDRW